jgi:hypothetical protein
MIVNEYQDCIMYQEFEKPKTLRKVRWLCLGLN